MAAARAGVLGVRWLQRAGRTVVPLGARTASHITKDMLPGPYPRTPEERAAAAKKYNLRVEDYEPYPDDGMGYGDYPKLPDRSQHERDPWYDWDHSDLRLNWGEPLHWDLDMYIRNRVDTSPTPVSWDVMCKHLFGFVAFMLFMFWVGRLIPPTSQWGQSSILIITCTWNEAAIPPKSLSLWFTTKSEETSWASCPLTDFLIPRD